MALFFLVSFFGLFSLFFFSRGVGGVEMFGERGRSFRV